MNCHNANNPAAQRMKGDVIAWSPDAASTRAIVKAGYKLHGESLRVAGGIPKVQFRERILFAAVFIISIFAGNQDCDTN